MVKRGLDDMGKTAEVPGKDGKGGDAKKGKGKDEL